MMKRKHWTCHCHCHCPQPTPENHCKPPYHEAGFCYCFKQPKPDAVDYEKEVRQILYIFRHEDDELVKRLAALAREGK